jgi:gliding motility-associated-like protein
MNKFYWLLSFIFVALKGFSQEKIPTLLPHNNQTQTQGISFVENKNQWEKPIQFRADLPSGFLFVYNNALQYSFYDSKAVAYQKHKDFYKDKPEYAIYQKDESIKAHSFLIEFLGANPTQVQASKVCPTHHHYYLGERSRWAENVRSYEKITYPNLYEGIDYHLFRNHNSLKYEIHLAALANPKQIQMRYSHAEKVHLLPNGSLEIVTTVGNMYEKKPVSYQYIKGKKVVIPTKFVVKENVVSFEFPKGYNKQYPLVIDPELVFSTYSGGVSDNWGNTATFDADENLYSGATVFGTNFPNFVGATTIGSLGGITDVGIFKYNATGTNLLQITFLGGSQAEVPHSLVVDSQNRLFILGTTSSSNFPTTLGGGFQGGSSISVVGINYSNGSDIFVAKLNANGTLNQARLIGGTGNDGLKPSGGTVIHNYGDELRGDIYVDNADLVYIASTTRSNNIAGFTGTLSGISDGLIAKMDNNLNLTWGQYFGGNGIDLALSIKTNNSGDIFVGGGTTSTNLPATTGSLNPTALGSDDSFIAKLNASGTLISTTYLGTNAADMAFFIDLDSDQEVYAFGQTFGNYPISAGVYSNPNGGQFIHKISPDLTTTRWSTRIGQGDGNPDISPTAFLVVTENNCNNIYIAGWGGNNLGALTGTSSGAISNMPTTTDAYRRTSATGSDFYIAVYKRNMERMLYGTFFGENASNEVGDHVDGGTSRFAKNGIIYHSTCASCGATNGFPTTPGAWSANNNSSNCNNAVFKFRLNVSASFQMLNPKNLQVVNSGTETCEKRLFFKFTALDADEFLWEILDAGNNVIYSQNTNKDFFYDFTVSGTYKIRLSVTNCNQTDIATQEINIIIPNFQINQEVKICRGESVQLQASGAISYQWKPTTGLNNPNIANPIASPSQTTTYTVTFIDDKCRIDQTVKVEVLPVLSANFDVKLLKDCNTPYRVKVNLPNTLDTTQFKNFSWDMGDGTILVGATQNEYVYKEFDKEYTITLTALNPNGCNTVVRKTIRIPAPPIEPPNAITPNEDGINDTFEVAEQGSKLEIWNRWGKRIFKSDNYKNDWGKEVVAGTYYYLLESPSGVKCNGWIQVIK